MPADRSAPEGQVVPPAQVNDPQNGDDSKLIVDKAVEFIEQAVAEEKPFFVVVWLHSPHSPIVDPETGLVDSPAGVKRSIEDIDSSVGVLRTSLRDLNVHESTMVWFTSDNGPEDRRDAPNDATTDRPIRTGLGRARKRSVYEGGLHVPGILEWPAKIPSGRATPFVASTSDYYPTILDYLGIAHPAPKALDGLSLKRVIDESAQARSEPIGFVYRQGYAWMAQRYKLVSTNGGGAYQLYDIVADPQERNNLAAAMPGVTSAMRTQFEAWLASVEADTTYLMP